MFKETRIGTWNVLTLCKRGALRNLEKALQEYKVDITTLQEINFSAQEHPFSYVEVTRWQNDTLN
jgi:exonuclease III